MHNVKLNLTNIQPHPTEKRFMVFQFKRKEQAIYFENILLNNDIPFEKDFGNEFLFAIKKQYLAQVKKYNYQTIGKFRKPFIPNKIFKYVVLAISTFAVALAILGYFISKLN